jgi:cell division topological specificity factor
MRGLIKQLNRLLGAEGGSKSDAKQRLKFLLIHDQVDLTPAAMESMKEEILQVIARYVEVDQEEVTFKLDREDGQVSLVSTMPVRRVTARA